MQNALIAIILLTPFFAFLGCMVVNNQMAFFSDAMGHAGLTGIAIGALLGIAQPLWAMISFSILLAIGITWMRKYSAASSDSIIGIVMSFTVALGIVILSRGGGFNRYSQFLVGDILSITETDLFMLAFVLLMFVIVWVFIFNRILLVSVSQSIARSRRVSVWFIQGLFACITSVIVTVSIQWVGILVINALLILPAATSRNIAVSIKSYIWYAMGVNIITGFTGLVASFYLSTATGATIVLFAMVLYLTTLAISRFSNR
jgi:zinc transport system permease protein